MQILFALQVAMAAFEILRKIVPVVIDVYNRVKAGEPGYTRANAAEKVIAAAAKHGYVIGDTEANLGIDAVHAVISKRERMKDLGIPLPTTTEEETCLDDSH
jgi:hypothetical protein